MHCVWAHLNNYSYNTLMASANTIFTEHFDFLSSYKRLWIDDLRARRQQQLTGCRELYWYEFLRVMRTEEPHLGKLQLINTKSGR